MEKLINGPRQIQKYFRATVSVLLCMPMVSSICHAGLSDPPVYRITDLGTLPGTDSSIATAINAKGQVVGHSFTFETSIRAYVYSGGKMVDLGALPGDSSSSASDINASGQVVGQAGVGGREANAAFLYSGGQMKDLGTLGGLNGFSHARAINAAGNIVGHSVRADDTSHAFFSDGKQMRDLGTLGGSYSDAYDINDSGEIVGVSHISGGFDEHAFLYSGGQMKDLGTLGGASSFAVAINNAGQIVGTSNTADGGSFAFLYAEGRMQALDNLSGFPSAINNAGQIIGRTTGTPFFYQDGQMYDINDLLEPHSGWTLTEAAELNDINDVGQIVGYGENPNGQLHAFLLSPVGGGAGGGPAPAVPLPPMVWAGLATLAGVGLSLSRRSRFAKW